MAEIFRTAFEKIYDTHAWGVGSGPGSYPEHTVGYRRFLRRYLSKRNIRSVVDLGCGDWQFSQFIDWSGVIYHGFDVVPDLIEKNNLKFKAENISFSIAPASQEELPPADLLIVKDVLQHLPNDTVAAILRETRRYPLTLVANCVGAQGVTENADTTVGGFRFLDIRKSPFNCAARQVYAFSENICVGKPMLEIAKTYLRSIVSGPAWYKIVLELEGSHGHQEAAHQRRAV